MITPPDTSWRALARRHTMDLPHFVPDEDGVLTHRPGWCALTDRFYGPPERFGTTQKRRSRMTRSEAAWALLGAAAALVFTGHAVAAIFVALAAMAVLVVRDDDE